MTTTLLLRTRTPLESLSMNQQPHRRKSKRGAAYDEEDDGFKFTRGSKRSRTEASVPESLPSRNKAAKQRQPDVVVNSVDPSTRHMNFATPKADPKPRRQGTRRSARLSNNDNVAAEGNAVDYDSIDMVGVSSVGEGSKSRSDVSKEPTKIALPFSDTPIINRNKELRRTTNGRRRSSLGLRGRRASSLIESGHSALPHSQVESASFYKIIAAEGLSEPRRMKQLLVWCAERALGDKPAYGNPNSSALLSARMVKEQIFKAFPNRSEMSDWFQRDVPAKTAVVKKPNPLDASNEVKIKEMEERVKRQIQERNQWKTLQKSQAPASPLLDPSGAPPNLSALDISLLDPEDASILESLKMISSGSLITSTQQNITSLQTSLEFKVDQFADGVHKLGQARQTMEKVAEKVMAMSAVRLEEREKEEKEALGTRDLPIQEVLRSLSRIMPDGGR